MLMVIAWFCRVPVKSSLVNWLTFLFSGSSVHFVILLGYPRIGSVARARCCLCGADCRISSHSVAACVGGCTMIPHARGLGLGGRHQSALRHFSANQFNGPLAPDPARLIRPRGLTLRCRGYTDFRAAPSGTSPRFTYFQSATSSFLARATANQRLSAEPGWLRSQTPTILIV